MSNTDMAPPPASTASTASAPSAPPAVGEVPINPNPVNPPAPLGSPAPQRQEVVAKAFERARVERKGPAEARAGHNQPPEPVESEKPAKPAELPLNLKKRPADQERPEQSPQSPPARERGEGGRYAPAQAKGAPPSQGQGVAPASDPYRQPPRRWSDQAKREWVQTPASVRAQVHNTHKQFSAAYRQFRGDHEVMNSIRPYYNLARSQGVQLKDALGNYHGIEQKLRGDPIGGLDLIVNNLNLRTSDGRKLGLLDVAHHVLTTSSEQHQLTQARNYQAAMAQQMAKMQQQQHAIAQQQMRMQYMQRFGQTRGQVDRFAETHPRLDELGSAIRREIRHGYDLPTAYRRAELLYPGGGGANGSGTVNGRPAAQTRATDRSISGAPDGRAANGAAPRKPTDRRGSVANAFRSAKGAL